MHFIFLVLINIRFFLQIEDIGHLSRLDVSYNKISHLSISLIDINQVTNQFEFGDEPIEYTAIRTIIVDNNPLFCECEIYNFLQVLKKKK